MAEAGPPLSFDPVELAARADAGDGEAAHRLALMAGLGLDMPHDWSEAMRRLEQAARAGAPRAAAALHILSAEGGLDPWLAPARPTRLSESPHVLTIEGFLPPRVCEALIAQARDRLSPASVYDNQTDQDRLVGDRSNSAAHFDFDRSDLILILIREKIARATGLPVRGLEPTQVLHYAPGQEFKPHFDYLDPDKPGHRADLERSGQRMATFLIYLNADFEGGETAMPAIGLKHRGGVGDALFWANVTRDGRPDPLTFHAGLPPSSGEKWLLSQWLRNREPKPREA